MGTRNDNERARQFVVVVTCRDRVGIVRDVTVRLEQWQANIESFSQTVVMSYFTLIFVVTFPEEHTTEDVREFARDGGAPGEWEVGVKVFEPDALNQPVLPDAERFVLTVTGHDRPGILRSISEYVASKGINIIDLYAYKSDPETFVMVSEIALPRQLNLSQVQLDIEQLGKQTGLAATLQHENIFKATNDVAIPAAFR